MTIKNKIIIKIENKLEKYFFKKKMSENNEIDTNDIKKIRFVFKFYQRELTLRTHHITIKSFVVFSAAITQIHKQIYSEKNVIARNH